MASNPQLPQSADQSWERLSNELWSLIFSHLEDTDLLRTVIPVSRRFRDIAYADGFRFENGSLGHHWGQYYRFSPEFLSAIPEPKSLQFTSSEKYHIDCMHPVYGSSRNFQEVQQALGEALGPRNDHQDWGEGRPPLTPYSPSQASRVLISSKK